MAAHNGAETSSECLELLDESQTEVHKSLVKFKVFKEEAEAKAFVTANKGWSAIGHSPKGYYSGKSIVLDLLEQAVDFVSKKFNLHVPLAVESVFGQTWADCH